MSSQYDKAMGEVDETYNFYMSMLAERKLDVTKEIEKLYSTKQVALSVFGQKIHESTDKNIKEVWLLYTLPLYFQTLLLELQGPSF